MDAFLKFLRINIKVRAFRFHTLKRVDTHTKKKHRNSGGNFLNLCNTDNVARQRQKKVLADYLRNHKFIKCLNLISGNNNNKTKVKENLGNPIF